jgi:hypothetical protein
MTDHISRIETDLVPEIETALVKSNIQRAVKALTESLKVLVEHAKETNEALAALSKTAEAATPAKDIAKKDEVADKDDKARQPAKKTPVKKTGGEPTSDVLKPVE